MSRLARLLRIGLGVLSFPLLAQVHAMQNQSCATVRGRYAIKVNNDYLWIVGSKHLVIAVIDALDKELQERGWESTVAYGDFTICANKLNPKQLTVQDDVTVKSYTNISFRSR